MPGGLVKLPYSLFNASLRCLEGLSDNQIVIMVGYMQLSLYWFSDEKGLSYRISAILLRIFYELRLVDGMTKTRLSQLIGAFNDSMTYPFNEYIHRPAGAKRYTLTTKGIELRDEWTAYLRRVARNERLYYEDLHLRSSKAGIAKRRKKCIFWQLPENEQIQLLRSYFVMPGHTARERRERRKAAERLFYQYGLKGKELLNAINHFGEVVTSVREMPEHRENHIIYLRKKGKA
jgi:hypothetical protein